MIGVVVALLLSAAPEPAPSPDAGLRGAPASSAGSEVASVVVKGRLQGYRGLFPFHVFALRSPDFGAPGVVAAVGTADAATGRFDLPLPDGVAEVYLFGQLDLARQGPTLIGQMVFPLRKLPLAPKDLRGVRHLFDLGDMELATMVRDGGPWPAIGLAAGFALLLYAVGVFWRRRLPQGPVGSPPVVERDRWAVGIALGTTALLLPNYASEPLALLEFTYAQEAFRPTSALALLFDPISAELSHPPLWALLTRALGAISRHEGWLRLPAILAHLPFVWLVYQLGAVALGRRGARVAAALAGLLPVGFWYARDATPYSLLGLISAAALWFALSERWRAFSLTLVLGFFLHYTVAVLGITLGVGLFLTARRTGDWARFRRALGAFGWVLPLPLGWSVHFIRTFLASGMSTRLMAVDYNPDPGFFSYVGHFASVVVGLPPALAPLLPLSLGGLLVGAWRLNRTQVARDSQQTLIGRAAIIQAAMVVGYVLFIHQMYMAFAAGRVYYAYRWVTVFLPGVVLAMAAAIDGLWRWRPRVGGAVLALQLALCLYQDVRIAFLPQRPAQWEAFATLRAEARPGDAFCALPAVYFAQTMNYSLFERYPADLLGLPRWTDGLYGPIHPVNTTVESIVQSLAFERVWVAAYAEEAFGTPEFDLETTAHHLAWMREHLIADGQWRFPFLDLYRFKVNPRPEGLWRDGRAMIDFSRTYEGFRYFPDFLHTQATGYIMSRADVRVRVPSPPGKAAMDVEVEMIIGGPATAEDLAAEGLTLAFEPTGMGGRWRGSVAISADRTDLMLHRSPDATKRHRNTIVRLTAR
jgi:hypothetical protein